MIQVVLLMGRGGVVLSCQKNNDFYEEDIHHQWRAGFRAFWW
jgi:hypothetical protein